MRLEETGDWLRSTPLLGVVVTLSAYAVGRWLLRRTGAHPLAQPVLVAIVLVGAFLALTGISYADYSIGGDLISFLLGPATVALAVPLHREWNRVRRAALPILLSITAGAAVSAASAMLVARVLGGDRDLQLSLAPKATTSPVAIALAEQVGGVGSLAAVLAIVAGITGAVAAPGVLTLLRVRDERVRGLAIGAVSHGIGTSRALQESSTAGAFSGLAMALTALATSALLPVLIWLL